METSETVLWESWGPAGKETCSDCVSVGSVAMKGPQCQLRWCESVEQGSVLDKLSS